MTTTKFHTLFIALALFSLAQLVYALAPVFVDPSGFAIRGYDPVAYFEDNKPVKGQPEFAYEWQGAKWLFSSQANKDAFAAEPLRYAPQYGGYCAYAVSLGKTASTDPKAWTIHDGKLYLNYSKSVQRTWSKNIAENIHKADQNWPKLLMQ